MNYQLYRQIFQNYVLQPWNETKTFSVSDDQRVLKQQGNLSFYPQLQLDTPTYRPDIKRGKSDLKYYEGQVAILQPVKKGDWAQEDQVLDQLEVEMDRLIAWLDYHRKLDFGYIREIGTIYPIKRFEHDNLFGWGVPFKIEIKANYCHDFSLDVEVVHLEPVFVEGETLLSLVIEGTPYVIPWSDSSQKDLVLTKMISGIAENPPDPLINVSVFLGQLILVHTQAQVPININIEVPGHSWIKS
jgi:hypothetical protein